MGEELAKKEEGKGNNKTFEMAVQGGDGGGQEVNVCSVGMKLPQS
jgi:hypothetical protein